MNWVDAVLIALLLAAVIIGSKKGLIRELTATVVVFASIILTVDYIDRFAVWLHQSLGGSTLVSAFLAFVLLLGATYAVFKLVIQAILVGIGRAGRTVVHEAARRGTFGRQCRV